MIHVLADVGYQSNWIDVLQASFMRNAFIGGHAGRDRVRADRLLRRRSAATPFAAHALAHIGFPGATVAVLDRRSRHARARGVLRRRRPRDRRARQARRQPRGRDRHDPGRSRPASASCSRRSPPRTRARSRTSCSATSSRSPPDQILDVHSGSRSRLRSRLAVIARPLAVRVGRSSGRGGQGRSGQGARHRVHGASRSRRSRWPSRSSARCCCSRSS